MSNKPLVMSLCSSLVSVIWCLQVGELVEFSLVSSTGVVKRQHPLLEVLVTVLCRRDPQAAGLLQQRQGREGPPDPAPLHLVHSLRDGGQGGGSGVGVQVGGGAEEGVLVEQEGRVGGDGRRVGGLPPQDDTASCWVEGR